MRTPIVVTEVQRANILSAKEMWLTVPLKNVAYSLDKWNSLFVFDQEHSKHDDHEQQSLTPDCNTICCFGGWCAHWPPFQEQGVYAGWAGQPVIKGKGVRFADQELFGVHQMFFGRGEHEAERILNANDSAAYYKTSDWQLVMNRIDWLIANSVVS